MLSNLFLLSMVDFNFLHFMLFWPGIFSDCALEAGRIRMRQIGSSDSETSDTCFFEDLNIFLDTISG